MLSLQLILGGLALVLVVVILHRNKVQRRTPHNRKIIDFHGAINFLQECTLHSRANANLHLRDAFGIMNPFVNGETYFHDQFVRYVSRQLRRVTSQWSELIHVSKMSAEQTSGMSDTTQIRNRVRVIVMSIALKIIEVDGYTTDELLRVGELIDLIWIQAKIGAPTGTHRDELHDILRRWKYNVFIETILKISDVNKAECAILSILIPAYETMYRVILPLTFHTHNKISFDHFLDPSVSESTLCSSCEEGYTYLALIQETLRRYPVVKRIKRETGHEMTSVDIAAIHLDEHIWERPEEFDPMRWMTSRRDGGYMPFGAGKGRCIANEKIVGLIVCMVLGVLEKPLRDFKSEDLRVLLVNDRGQQYGTSG